ncbi:PIG-L deacetylase family protein [Streptomyces gilvus]|uniref:PIG-L deacetylase family protein n=1 Tax=Streptomyces gilvus TaxID=2920937 RepID=UPI001F0FC1CC|nr:PIG-L deacetylase family protein [Streptomyces sp. CME 23]MCH5676650.1 PIG-L family deacetylase [Streptomyces sp. CME 23]
MDALTRQTSLPSLLAVFAHPDDESLAAGGVLARHAESGARTGVVTATWGEGTRRAGELAEALRILGAGEPRLLGYADARVPESAPGRARFCDAPLDEVVGRLVAQSREFRPDIVVTHDAYGNLSGHPDHVRAHRVTVLAVEAAGWARLHPGAGTPWRVGALYLATHPDSAARALGHVLVRPGRDLFSVPDERIDVAVDVRPWVRRKLDAVMAHRSEVERGALPGRLAALPEELRARLMSTEWYTRHGSSAYETVSFCSCTG